MRLDLSAPPPAAARTWTTPGRHWPAIARATEDLPAPVTVLHADALRANVHDMLRRTGGTPIRVASKSVRVRDVLDAVLAVEGYHGVLAYTLAEGIWLAAGGDGHPPVADVLVAYPSADRAAIRTLATDAALAARVTLMVDSIEHLDLIDSVLPPARREEVRLCLELDCSFPAGPLGRIGVWRSPVHTPAEAARLAARILARPGFRLVGMMGYEAQIAGQGDAPPGRRAWGAALRAVQRRSKAELLERRAAAVRAVRGIVDLEFVNGGGTGSLEFTSGDPAVTEVAAGSGLFGGHLFDTYRAFTPAPAAAFGLDVVRRPDAAHATLAGGGWIASGPPAADRLPQPVWPQHLSFAPREGAGEVQTPVAGDAAAGLRVGDRVWLRHTKSGELSEHTARYRVLEAADGGGLRVAGTAETYRGEGRAFL